MPLSTTATVTPLPFRCFNPFHQLVGADGLHEVVGQVDGRDTLGTGMLDLHVVEVHDVGGAQRRRGDETDGGIRGDVGADVVTARLIPASLVGPAKQSISVDVEPPFAETCTAT